MKRLTAIFIATIALLICGVIVGYSYNAANVRTASVSITTGDNLAIDDNTFVDLVFDKDGVLLENSVYEWNIESNTKGRLLVSTKRDAVLTNHTAQNKTMLVKNATNNVDFGEKLGFEEK